MKNDRKLAYAALVFVCLVWGSTFLAVKCATSQIGPFRTAFLRQFMAVGLMLFWLLSSKKRGEKALPSRQQIVRQLLIGASTIGAWNVLANFAIMTIPTSLAALCASLVPAYIAILCHFWTKTEQIRGLQWLGIALGFGGLGLIFSDGWQREMSAAYAAGIGMTMAAAAIWAVGTVAAKKFVNDSGDLVFDSAMQLLGGGLVALFASFFYDFWMPFELDQIGIAALFYLVIFGSVLAMTAYLFALKNLPATIASMYTYINPIIALILGSIFLNERMTVVALIGMSITLVGVYLVNRKKQGF